MKTVAIVHPKLAESSFVTAIRPLLTCPENYEKVGVRLLTFSFPHLDVELNWHRQGTKLRLRIDGTNFPYRPVSGWWVDVNGVPLLRGSQQVPMGGGFHITDQDGGPRCWFCFRGWAEYHNHFSHQDVSWASIRKEPRYRVLQLITELANNLNNGNGVTRV